MSASRQAFYREIRSMAALSRASLLMDVFPPDAPHNVPARILRRGVAVSAFSLLEGFLKDRLDEIFTQLGASRMGYFDLEEGLRKFITGDAIIGLANRLSFLRGADRQQVGETFLAKLAGYATRPPTYTALGFSPRGSNVSRDDIKGALAALGATDGWGRLSSIARSIGSSRVSLSDDYQNLSNTRNRAAHNSITNIPTSDLETHIEVVTIVGITFDVLTTSLVEARLRAKNQADLRTYLTSMHWNLRFVDERTDGLWAERSSNTGGTIKIYGDEQSARLGASGRRGTQFVIIRDPRGIPVELL